MNRRAFLAALPLTIAATKVAIHNASIEPEQIKEDPFARLMRQKLEEHKRDLEHAFLFGFRAEEHKTTFGTIRMVMP